MRMLLVEDNAHNVEFFSAVLEGDGHELVVERDGGAGLARGLVERFDLILLDIQLPGMPGDAVCRELRRSGVRTPILAITSSAMPEQIERGLAQGFDRYLTKPISAAAFRDVVKSYAAGER